MTIFSFNFFLLFSNYNKSILTYNWINNSIEVTTLILNEVSHIPTQTNIIMYKKIYLVCENGVAGGKANNQRSFLMDVLKLTLAMTP